MEKKARRSKAKRAKKEQNKQFMEALVGLADTLKSVVKGNGSDGEDESPAGAGKLKRIIRHGPARG